MPIPSLDPISVSPKFILPSTGNQNSVQAALAHGVYTTTAFNVGAANQVAQVYKSLGGDVMDIELSEQIVYTNYEYSVLEYSYIVSIHQAKNSLGSMLGNTTASYDQGGQMTTNVSSAATLYPNFRVEMQRRQGEAFAKQAGFGRGLIEYSASFATIDGQQTYDLQAILQSSSADSTSTNYGLPINNRQVVVTKVFYISPRAMWRFFGFYGGINAVGNLSTYGMYTDDSTFEVIPAWMNKLQAMAFEDNLKVRTADYSYELRNNVLKLYPPIVGGISPPTMWFKFYVQDNATTTGSTTMSDVYGVNNMSNLPFANIPYESINAIGKHWIRKYCISLCKETLGQIRGKFSTIPIPGNTVTLNAEQLLRQAAEEQKELRKELFDILNDLTYDKLTERNAKIANDGKSVMSNIPLPIYVG